MGFRSQSVWDGLWILNLQYFASNPSSNFSQLGFTITQYILSVVIFLSVKWANIRTFRTVIIQRTWREMLQT